MVWRKQTVFHVTSQSTKTRPTRKGRHERNKVVKEQAYPIEKHHGCYLLIINAGSAQAA